MKTVILCLLLMATSFAAENATTKPEQQLDVQKREKPYLIEDDPNEGPEQKRDQRQSNPAKNNQNLDSKGNSRIINIRLQPALKQAIKPGVLQKPVISRIDATPQRIPTKIPVILKTAKVIPGPAHAQRMKVIEDKINQSITNSKKENSVCPITDAPLTLRKESIPDFTIEDKTTRKTESHSSPNNIHNDFSNHEDNVTLNRDGQETSGNDEKSPLDKNTLNEIKDDQVPSSLDRKTTFHKNKDNSDSSEPVQKPIHFYVDEPEPLPPSNRRQLKFDNSVSQCKEVTPNKKEIPIVRKNKTRKDDLIKDHENDDEANDPDAVRISNGTHMISIKKIQNDDRYKIERLLSRDGEENTALTEERIVNHEPPKPKPTVEEPEKHSFRVTEKSKAKNEKNLNGLAGLVFKDKIKEEQDQNDCITITKHKYEEFEEKSPISPALTFQPSILPTAYNDASQESWNYLQNPNYNPYHKNVYDKYRRNYGIPQSIPNIYGQEIIDPRNYGVQIIPSIQASQQSLDPDASNAEVTLSYYPNEESPTETDSTQYPYNPIASETQPEIDDIACPIRPEVRSEVRPENTLDRIWRAWKDVEIKIRKAQLDGEPLDIDIRRNFDDKFNGNKGENGMEKTVKPYATTSLPINLNSACPSTLMYPHVNPGYRYMH